MSKVNEQSVSPASVNLYYVFRPVHSQRQAGHEAKRQRVGQGVSEKSVNVPFGQSFACECSSVKLSMG